MDPKLMVDFTRAWVTYHLQQLWLTRTDDEDSDRGDVPGWVIIVGITVALAIAVGAVIYNKVIDKANNITIQ